MSSLQGRKRKLLALFLIKYVEDDEEDDRILQTSVRKPVSRMFLKRQDEGAFNILHNNYLIDEEEKFKRYFRFTREQFNFILNNINDDLEAHLYNRVKLPISAAEKLAVTLGFLVTGESHRSLAFSYRISPSAISVIVPKVLQSIKEKLVPKFLPGYDRREWKRKAEEFRIRWNFLNCVAAIDGKHVRIVAPANSGSIYFNYKGYFSIVLLAMVDANYKFLLVDVGSYGKEVDSGIFKKSRMASLVGKKAIFPPPEYLPDSNILLQHVIVGDEAFSLSEHIIKPYCKKQALTDLKKRTFNYNLSRARRVSENAFGIMGATFRIFFTPINIKPKTADNIILVCCCLHNMLRGDYSSAHLPTDEGNPEELPTDNMIPLAGGFAKSEGFQVRSRFTDYFNKVTT